MKLSPRHSRIVGRMVIAKSESTIILVDETKVTKFILIDAVGDEAASYGIKVGDVVLPTALANIVINGGRSFRPVLEEKDIAFLVTDVTLDELVVQTDNGAQYVPFDSPHAAQPLGAPAVERAAEAA